MNLIYLFCLLITVVATTPHFMDITEPDKYISISKDIALAITAIVGSYVGVSGLNTWKRELKGNAEYELSRKILVNLFKYRDTIHFVRLGYIWSDEMPHPPEEEAKKMNHEEISFYGTLKAYEARWKKVQDQKAILYADLLEAEAIFGTDLNDLFKVVWELEKELLEKIKCHLKLIDPNTPEPSKETIREFNKNQLNIVFDIPDSLSKESDKYKSDLLNAIGEIENYLKPKLSHGINQPVTRNS